MLQICLNRMAGCIKDGQFSNRVKAYRVLRIELTMLSDELWC